MSILRIASAHAVETFDLATCHDGEPSAGDSARITLNVRRANAFLERGTFEPMRDLGIVIAPDTGFRVACAAETPQCGVTGTYERAHGTLRLVMVRDAPIRVSVAVPRLLLDCGPTGTQRNFPTHVKAWIDPRFRVLVLRTQLIGAQDWCNDPTGWTTTSIP